jgi:hypothetical protein
MVNENQYSFVLDPGKKRRRIAGTYDVKSQRPHYEIDINVPEHVRNQIEVNQILIGNEEYCQWAWDIKNNSSWPAFVTIKKDGVTVVDSLAQ